MRYYTTLLLHRLYLYARDRLMDRDEMPGVYGERRRLVDFFYRALDRGHLDAADDALTQLLRDPYGVEGECVRMDTFLRHRRYWKERNPE